MLLIRTMKATLLALVLVTYVVPSAGPPQEDEDYESPESDDSWSPDQTDHSEFQELEYHNDPDILMLQPLEDPDLSQTLDYYNLPEDVNIESKISSDQMPRQTYSGNSKEGFFDPWEYLPLIEKVNENPANELDFKRMISFPWSKGRKAKPHDMSSIKNQYCRISAPPSKRPVCQGSTTDRPTCPYSQKPTAPPPTPKPQPSRDQCNKSQQKPKIRPLNPKTAKMILQIIMDTKQHVLFTLQILNHMENEVLTRSPDLCHQQNPKPTVPNKCCPAPKKKPEKSPKCPSYSNYQRKAPSFIAIQRDKQLKKKKQHSAFDPADNWCPASSNQAANRVENAPKPSGLKRFSCKKFWNRGQKPRTRMTRIPPGMVAILA
ncbi:uncharacterized protein LOC110180095 [Drosophila serrata]|uniref:uncharacterized protein LOC110180095 n=1 Tax=Drosophila serrata TaxID=7274 RepID=UPI000A1D0EF1|nr:uncharacterized protein LOC110180095 [Drosophila serrata]